MNEKWFADLKAEVMAFFDNATKEEIDQSLENANYDIYKDIDIPLIQLHDSCDHVGFFKATKIKFDIPSGEFGVEKLLDFYELIGYPDEYNYCLAA